MTTFDEYVDSLSQLTEPFDPTIPTDESEEIREIASALATLPTVDHGSLAGYIRDHPHAVPVLGLAVGLTREKLKNILKDRLGTAGWVRLAEQSPADVIAMLDDEYDLVRLVVEQRSRDYDFGDILVARSGTRRAAAAAGATGRHVEDEIEAVAHELGLSCETRTRFAGRGSATAPCDLAIPAGGVDAKIVVAAKGFDSTGSKLSDAVREIEEMAEKRRPTQFVLAAVDGIGWKNRLRDLRRIYDLAESHRIDGLYTLAALDTFSSDLEDAARRLGLL